MAIKTGDMGIDINNDLPGAASGSEASNGAVVDTVDASDFKTSNENTAAPEMEFPHNILEAFGTGAMLDLRVRMATSFLTTSPMFHGLAVATTTEAALNELPRLAAGIALNLADELLRQGAALGWVTPLPPDAELSEQVRMQATRTAAFSVLQQSEGQKMAQEMQGQVMPAVAAIMRGRGH